MFEASKIELKQFVKDSTEHIQNAYKQGISLNIPVGESWSVGTHPEVGPYKIDPADIHSLFQPNSEEEKFICKSLINPFMPIGTGITQEAALESFIYNQTFGEETRISSDFVL
jgi:hypothetical protein